MDEHDLIYILEGSWEICQTDVEYKLKPDDVIFFTTEDLTKRLLVSDRTLRNKFKKVYGQSIYRYQMEIKLQKACELLKDYSNMKISEIAANLGFYDEFHFSKTFKKSFGTSPTEFKILYKNSN